MAPKKSTKVSKPKPMHVPVLASLTEERRLKATLEPVVYKTMTYGKIMLDSNYNHESMDIAHWDNKKL